MASLLPPICKSTAYHTVPAAAKHEQSVRTAWRKDPQGTRQDQLVAVASAILTGAPLAIALLAVEGSVRILQWIREIADEIGAEVVVTEDAKALKHLADELGCQPQICRAPV